MRRIWMALVRAFGSGVEAELDAQRRAAAQLDRALRDALRGAAR